MDSDMDNNGSGDRVYFEGYEKRVHGFLELVTQQADNARKHLNLGSLMHRLRKKKNVTPEVSERLTVESDANKETERPVGNSSSETEFDHVTLLTQLDSLLEHLCLNEKAPKKDVVLMNNQEITDQLHIHQKKPWFSSSRDPRQMHQPTKKDLNDSIIDNFESIESIMKFASRTVMTLAIIVLLLTATLFTYFVNSLSVERDLSAGVLHKTVQLPETGYWPWNLQYRLALYFRGFFLSLPPKDFEKEI